MDISTVPVIPALILSALLTAVFIWVVVWEHKRKRK